MLTRTVIVFGLLALVACAPTGERDSQIIRDESGAAFYWPLGEIPNVTPSPLACDDGGKGFYAEAWNEYFFIASRCPGDRYSRLETWRCVVCEADSDCPSGHQFECGEEGVCRNTFDWDMSPYEYQCGNTAPRWGAQAIADQAG